MKTRYSGALGAFAVAIAGVAFPAVSQAEDNCDYNYFLNTDTNQCQFCNDTVANWNYDTNQCLPADPTPYVDPNPILGPAGPVGVGPNPVVGPVGPVGVGPNPVVGPVGPVGIGRR